eukprot:CAMPEP_0113614458 /NCGR_PEP_ID=MMETSP0017_2-20120614/7177_1 /TAXON_ID=2856 /ORGANISM="Cylindrotheca closterium" /LENGTH=578 /DNA_ID=CAMNT_0000523627 /DNA_START=54 /DNA_END=1793 /DNA_ORIENTATION=- /assembly_acc=CAM_ASM_000147
MTSYHYFGNEGEAIPEDVEELVIHPLVQEIPEEACCKFRRLTRVNFNGSALRTIGDSAFSACGALREIDILPSVRIVGDSAFEECYSLSKIHFHEDGFLTTIGDSAFSNCWSLTELSIPTETIQQSAFEGCTCLARVSFQEGLEVIESCAFEACVKLETVELPRSLEMVGFSAFSNCTLLREVDVEEGNLTVIDTLAFQGCVNLQNISIPSTVEHLGSNAFASCYSLEVLKFRNGLKSVGGLTFYRCKNLQTVALPGSVERIDRLAFAGCPKLVSVELGGGPRAVTIRDDAFSRCQSLVNICLSSDSEITISNSTGDGVSVSSFRGCTALENQYGETNIPNSLMRRFDSLPIHKKCYYASITTADELVREIESSRMQSSQDTGTTTIDRSLVDPFGMTPFHVLMSAANCRMDLLQVLLAAYPPNVLGWKDDKGKTAMEYLTQRNYLTEDSRNMLRMALQHWMVGSISSWKALEAWKLDMSSRVNAIVAADEVEQRQSLLEGASMVLLRYERVEATTLLELSLWKMELESSANVSEDDDGARTIVDKDDRETCRIGSGASVVIPNVMGLLYENAVIGHR